MRLGLFFFSLCCFGRSSDLRNELIETYFNKPTRDGPDGVEAAVSFLVDQASRPPLILRTATKDTIGGVCSVTHDRVISEGLFVFENKSQPYDYTCFCARARYHVAPACRSIRVPPWRWRWSLPAAESGLCQLPDASPPKVAEAFLTARKSKKKVLNVLFLGLSFMGQPFQSLGCLHRETLKDGFFRTARFTKEGERGQNVSLAEITKNKGQCLGVDNDTIDNYFPKETHHNISLPRQNVYHCSTDHSLFEFQDDDYTTRVCFQYMFNMKKNLKAGAKLPCDLDWQSLDLVLSIFPNHLMKDFYLPKLRAPPDISTIFLSVMDVYQATLEPQLRQAYLAKGWTPPSHKDLLALPTHCSKPDVHYALPGFTDHAVTVWLSIIASGLPPINKKRGPTFVGRWS